MPTSLSVSHYIHYTGHVLYQMNIMPGWYHGNTVSNGYHTTMVSCKRFSHYWSFTIGIPSAKNAKTVVFSTQRVLYVTCMEFHDTEILPELLDFARGIHRSPMVSLIKCQYSGLMMFCLGWYPKAVDCGVVGDLKAMTLMWHHCNTYKQTHAHTCKRPPSTMQTFRDLFHFCSGLVSVNLPIYLRTCT